MKVNDPSIAPLRTLAARRAIVAPDLSRYLDRSNVDLMVTDQVQALQVRVRRGVEVFEQRLNNALTALRAGFAWRGGLLGAATFTTVYVAQQLFGAAATGSTGQWIGFGLGVVVCFFAALAFVRSSQDHRQLTALQRRCAALDIDPASSSEEVLAIADDVLSAGKALGALPGESL